MKLAITTKEQDNLYQQQTRQPANQATRDPRENNNNSSNVGNSAKALLVASPVPSVDPAKAEAISTRLKDLYKTQDTIPKLIEDDEDGTEQKISEYYVKLQMVVDDGGANKYQAYANDKVAGEKIGIEVENIFSKVDDKHPETGRVLILGGAGVGKTTLLNYMANAWANGTVWQGKFDYVFRVRLKELLNSDWKSDYSAEELAQNKLACFLHYGLKSYSSNSNKVAEGDINELIKSKLKEAFKNEQKKQQALEKIAKGELDIFVDDLVKPKDLSLTANDIASISGKDKVLFLLDGYDEIAHLANSMKLELTDLRNDYKEILASVFKYKNVVMSSRPNALDYKLKGNFERTIENKGLDEQGIYEYIDRKFSKENKGQAELGQELKLFLQKSGQVMDMCHVPINIGLISLVWTDEEFRAKFAGSADTDNNSSNDFSLGQLYHEVIVWLGKRYMMKFGQGNIETASDIVDDNVLTSPEVEFLTKVAYKSFVETGKLVPNKLVTESLGQLNIRNVVKFGLLKPEGDSKDITKLNYQFIHLTFQEYLTAYNLKKQLEDPQNKAVNKEAANLVAKHRVEPKYQMTLKFLSGLVASEGNKDKGNAKDNAEYQKQAQELVIRFWETVTANIDGTVELGLESKVTLYMHLLGQSRVKGGHIDSRIPNLEKMQQLIDSTILTDLSKWQQQIIESRYISPKLVAEVKGIIEAATNKGEEGEAYVPTHVHLKASTEIVAGNIYTGLFGTKAQLFEQFMAFTKLKDWQLQKLGIEKAAKVVDQLVPKERLAEAVKNALASIGNSNLIGSIENLLANVTTTHPKIVYDNLQAIMSTSKKTIIFDILPKIAKGIKGKRSIQELEQLIKCMIEDSEYQFNINAFFKQLVLGNVIEEVSELFKIFTQILIDNNASIKTRANMLHVFADLADVMPKKEVDKAITLIKPLLSDNDVNVRSNSVLALEKMVTKINEMEATELLHDIFKVAISDLHGGVALKATVSLGEIARYVPEDEVENLLNEIKNLIIQEGATGSNIKPRIPYILRYLSEFMSQENLMLLVFDLFQVLIADKNTKVKLSTANVLNEVISSKSAMFVGKVTEMCQGLMKDQDINVRISAVKILNVLFTITSRQNLEELISIFRYFVVEDENTSVRIMGISFLAPIAKVVDRTELAGLINICKSLANDQDTQVKTNLIYALKEIISIAPDEDKKELFDIARLLVNSSDTKLKSIVIKILAEVVVMLSQESLTQLINVIKPALQDHDQDIRCSMINFFKNVAKTDGSKLFWEDCYDLLQQNTLGEQSVNVRVAIADFLKEVIKIVPEEKLKEVVELLKPLLNDKDWNVVFSACNVVGNLVTRVPAENLNELINLLKPLFGSSDGRIISSATNALSKLIVVTNNTSNLEEILNTLYPILLDPYKVASAADGIVTITKLVSSQNMEISIVLVSLLIKSGDSYAKYSGIGACKIILMNLPLDEIAAFLNNDLLEIRETAKSILSEKLKLTKEIAKLTHSDIAALAKLIADTKGSIDTQDKAIHDGADKALQEIAATMDEADLVWLNEHFAELPNLPQLLAFLKTICHKTLSDGKLEAAEAEFLANCVVKKGITATFELNEKVVIFEDARYSISEGAEYIDKIAEQAIENATNEVAKQYREHVPMFVNTERVLEKAATDIKDVSIVDGNSLKNNAWKISLLHKSNHEKVAPSQVFVLLEKSSYTGEHIIKKVVFDKLSGKLVLEKEYSAHPYRADALREEIFGKMEYSLVEGKARYYGLIYEMELSVDASSELIEDIKSGKLALTVGSVSDSNSSAYNMLHQFVFSLLSGKSVVAANTLSELSKPWLQYVGSSIVQEFDRAKLLKVKSELVRKDSEEFARGKKLIELEGGVVKLKEDQQETKARVAKLEEAQQAFEQIKEKIRNDVKISQDARKAMSTQIAAIEGKLQGIANQKDLDIITSEVTKLINEGKFTKGRLADLEDQVDELATHQDKTDERLDKLEAAQQAFGNLKNKLAIDSNAKPEDKKTMLAKIEAMESKLASMADKNDLETVTSKVIELVNESKFTKGRISDLEDMVDELMEGSNNKAETTQPTSEVKLSAEVMPDTNAVNTAASAANSDSMPVPVSAIVPVGKIEVTGATNAETVVTTTITATTTGALAPAKTTSASPVSAATKTAPFTKVINSKGSDTSAKVEELRGKVKTLPLADKDKEALLKQVDNIAKKVELLKNEKDLETATVKLVNIASKPVINKVFLMTLEKDIDTLVSNQKSVVVSKGVSGTGANIYKVNMVTEIIYDNPILNDPQRLNELLKYYTLDEILGANSNLDGEM